MQARKITHLQINEAPFRINVYRIDDKFSIECAFPTEYEDLLKLLKNKKNGIRIKATEDGFALSCDETNDPLRLHTFINLLDSLKPNTNMRTQITNFITYSKPLEAMHARLWKEKSEATDAAPQAQEIAQNKLG